MDEAPRVNPYEPPLRSIDADQQRESFTQRWRLITAAVGTLSRAVAWGVTLFVVFNYLPGAIELIESRKIVLSRTIAACFAIVERMATIQTALWSLFVMALLVDFLIRWTSRDKRSWVLMAWNTLTYIVFAPFILLLAVSFLAIAVT